MSIGINGSKELEQTQTLETAKTLVNDGRVNGKNTHGILNDVGIAGISYGHESTSNMQAYGDIKSSLMMIKNFGSLGELDKANDRQIKSLVTDAMGALVATKNLAKSIVDAPGVPTTQAGNNGYLEQANSTASLSGISSRSFSDYDIRELMKLLIKAFSQLMTSQRQSDLNTINGIIQALETKIASMEQSRDANYKAAIATAVGSLVAGGLQILGTTAQLAKTGKALKTKNEAKIGTAETAHPKKPTDTTTPEAASKNKSTDDPYLGIRELFAEEPTTTQKVDDASKLSKTTSTSAGAKVEISPSDMLQKEMNDGRAISEILGGAGGLSNAIAALISAGYTSEAKTTEIETAKTDALLEVLRKAQENGSSAMRQLLEFISKLLSTMQELQQNAASTERTIVA